MAAPWRATVAGIAMSSGLGGPLLAVSGSVAAVETLGAGDQRLDCDQVVQHRSVGDPLVAALDGLEDAPMGRVRARGPGPACGAIPLDSRPPASRAPCPRCAGGGGGPVTDVLGVTARRGVAVG